MKKFIIFGLFVTIASNIFSQSGISKVEANYILNFATIFDWPSSHSTGNFVIGVYNNPDISKELGIITNGQKIGVQNIVIKDISQPEQAAECQIVYIQETMGESFNSLADDLKTATFLLIGRKENLASLSK